MTWHIPDLDDGLLISANVLGTAREEVETAVDVNRLHHALLAPSAYAGGAPIHRSLAEVVASVFVECATGKIMPRSAVRFGWLMAQRTIELNRHHWRPQEDDAVQLRRFDQQLRAGLDPGRSLARWMEERILPNRDSSGPSPAARPPRRIHVSSPITGLSHDELSALKALATAVDDGLNEWLEERELPDEATTIRPQVFSIVAEDDWNAAIDRRVGEADGLVVLAYRASWGAAFELVRAVRTGIPVLFLHPAELELSRRVEGLLEEAQATCLTFEASADCRRATEQVATLVQGWLRSHYAAIFDTARRRAMMDTRVARFIEAVRIRQTQMSPLEQRQRLAQASLSETRCRALTGPGWRLQAASLAEFIKLSTAFDVRANLDAVEINEPSDRPLELTDAELACYADVVRVDRIPQLEATRMVVAAQREVSLAGRRRKTFTDDISWRQLRRRLHEAS